MSGTVEDRSIQHNPTQVEIITKPKTLSVIFLILSGDESFLKGLKYHSQTLIFTEGFSVT